MPFENAFKGVKKLRLSVIFIFTILIVVGAFSLITHLTGMTTETLQAYLKEAGTYAPFAYLLALLCLLIMVILCFIWRITGITSAMRDEPLFKKALMWLCIGFVFMIPASFLQRGGTALYIIVRICAQVLGLLPDYFILAGLQSICGRLQAADAEALVRRDTRIYLILRIIYVVAVPLELLIPVQYVYVLSCVQPVILIHALSVVRNLLQASTAKS